jgi:hypothetical protein
MAEFGGAAGHCFQLLLSCAVLCKHAQLSYTMACPPLLCGSSLPLHPAPQPCTSRNLIFEQYIGAAKTSMAWCHTSSEPTVPSSSPWTPSAHSSQSCAASCCASSLSTTTGRARWEAAGCVGGSVSACAALARRPAGTSAVLQQPKEGQRWCRSSCRDAGLCPAPCRCPAPPCLHDTPASAGFHWRPRFRLQRCQLCSAQTRGPVPG